MPACLRIYADPAHIAKCEQHELKAGEKLLDKLCELYSDGWQVPTTIARLVNGKYEEIELNGYRNDGLIINADDDFIVIHTPLGFKTLAIVGGTLLFGPFFGAAMYLASSLIPKTPELPAPPGQVAVRESPNNSLSGQTNLTRLYDRIPDIYGKNRVWPDLIARSYYEYIDHIKYVTEFFCIGRGDFLVENIKSGDTPIENITGSEVTVYPPGTALPLLWKVIESGEVNGQDVISPDDEFSIVADFYASSSKISSSSPGFDRIANLTSGDTFTILDTVSNNGTYTFNHSTSAPPLYNVFINETSLVDESNKPCKVSSTFAGPSIIGPFSLRGQPQDAWLDFEFPRGLFIEGSPTAGNVTIKIKIYRYDVDDVQIGSSQDWDVEFHGNTRLPLYFTQKFSGITTGGVRYAVSVQRLTDKFVGDAGDNIKWTGLKAATRIVALDVGDVTTVLVKTHAMFQATKLSERSFNAVVTRKLKTYSLSTHLVSSSTSATEKFADAILHMLTDPLMGAKSASQIDLDTLYTIQAALEGSGAYAGGVLGKFCYSFSDKNVPVAKEILTVCNAVRVTPYHMGQQITFVREEAKSFRTTLFNGRTKKPDSETRSVRFQKAGDKDGVELLWSDSILNTPKTIIFPEGTEPSNPLSINAAGIKNYKQAWNRAKMEYDRLVLQRLSAECQVTIDGGLCSIGDRIANCDGTNVNLQNGEVISIDGLTIITSERVIFGSYPTGVALFRGENGDVSDSVVVSPLTNNEFGFILDNLPSVDIFARGTTDNQVSSLYSFYVEGNTDADDFIVRDIAVGEDGYVKLKLLKYDPAIYAADQTTPTTEV